jgi:transcriptional regulator with XRE-family HTH domain
MAAPGERSRWGIGGEWCLVPAITPWAARGAIGQWRCRVSIGEILTAARRQAGLTIIQVSERTRIRETIIRGIERDDFSACGGDFYARGHIRAIARTAGVDPEPLIREYDSSQSAPRASTAGGPGPPAPLRLRQRRRPNWSVALLVMLAAVIGLVAYHLMASQPAGSGTAAAPKPVTAHQAARKHPAAKSTSPPAAASPSLPDVVIFLTAVSEPCWADTTSAGATIFQGTIDLGTSETWTERQAVNLRLGNPGAVTLTVDGQSRTGLGSAPVTLSLAPGQGVSG